MTQSSNGFALVIATTAAVIAFVLLRLLIH